MQVTDLLVPHFPEIMDVEFTAQIEESLDKIEEGDARLGRRRSRPSTSSSRATSRRPGKKMDNVKVGVDAGRGVPGVRQAAAREVGALRQVPRLLGLSGLQVHQGPERRARAAGRRADRRDLPDVQQADGHQARPLRQVHRVLGLSGVQDHQAGDARASRARSRAAAASSSSGARARARPSSAARTIPTCKFVVWQRPVAEPCPKCAAPFLTERDRARRQASPGSASARSAATGRKSFPRSPESLPVHRRWTRRSAAFLEYLRSSAAPRRHTLRSYRPISTEFSALPGRARRSAALAGGGYARASGPTWRALHERGLAKATIARKLAAVRSCFRFLVRRGVLEVNPAREVRSPRLPGGCPSFLPMDETEVLLRRRARSASVAGARDRALLELLYASGLRVAELRASTSTTLDRSRAHRARPRQGQQGARRARRRGRARGARGLPGAPRARGAGRSSATRAAAGSPRAACTRIVRRAARRGRDRPAGDAPHAAPHLRHPPARRRAPTSASSRSSSATAASPPPSATPT